MSQPSSSPAPSQRRSGAWLLAFALVGAHAIVLWYSLKQHAAWVYPRWFDQVQYLSEAYRSYLAWADDDGWAAVVARAFQPSPQGALHDTLPLLTMISGGPSRIAILTVHVAAFLLVALVLFWVTRRTWPGRHLEWFALAFLFLVRPLWSGESGSVADYRLEWVAMCLYGVTSLLLVRTDGFASRRWSLAFGVAAGATIAGRFLTAVYFGGVGVVLLVLCAWSGARKERLKNLGWAGLTMALVSGPILWAARDGIVSYYWFGHVSGPERGLRDAGMDFFSSGAWSVREFFQAHVGAPSLAIMMLSVIAIAVPALRRRSIGSLFRLGARWPLLAAGVMWIVPMVVLALHPAKAPQPLSIGLVPAVFLAVVLLSAFAVDVPRGVLSVVGGIAVLLALLVSAGAMVRGPRGTRGLDESVRIAAVTDYLTYRAQQTGRANPAVAVMAIVEGITAPALNVFAFERHQWWPGFLQTLPTGLFEPERSEVSRQLEQSDFVLFPRTPLASAWPFDQHVALHHQTYRVFCEERLRWVADFPLFGVVFGLYERQEFAAHMEPPRLFSAVEQTVQEAPRAPQARPAWPPVWLGGSERIILWSTARLLRYAPSFGYTPISLRAEGELPAQLAWSNDGRRILGHARAPGDYPVTILATNAAGTTRVEAVVRVQEGEFVHRFSAPERKPFGEPIVIEFQLLDTLGKLHFIDFSDLTEQRVLGRLVPEVHQQVYWDARFSALLEVPGQHHLSARMVRYDPSRAEPYFFEDHVFQVEMVEPAAADLSD